jgi:hypothetical protein
MSWSTRADVVTKLRRHWDHGEFLTGLAEGRQWEPLEVALRGPTARDLAERFGEVHAWVDRWQATNGRGMRVETRTLGGRVVGTNEIPHKVWIDSYDQLWSLIERSRQVSRFTELLTTTRTRAPRIAEWMVSKPLEALRFADEWNKLTNTVLWISCHSTHDKYLRQIDVPGVDTKFIERHRGILSALLDRQLPADRVDHTRPPSDFAGRYGFRTKPDYVRFRWLGHRNGYTEMSVQAAELADKPPDCSAVFVVENEITYLAFPPPEGSIVVFGGGYALPRLNRLTWLADKDLIYWGDIDTHGFAILNQLRRRYPHARSILMDRPTLLTHEAHWTHEPKPVNTHLELLTSDEAALYTDLVEDTLGDALRLEQERGAICAIERALQALHHHRAERNADPQAGQAVVRH